MNSTKSRRRFLTDTGSLAGLGIAAGGLRLPDFELGRPTEIVGQSSSQTNPDYSLRIKNSAIEIAPKRIISATTYNGQFPGPLLRFKEGRQVTMDIYTSFQPAANSESHSLQILLASVSITRTIEREQILPPDNTAAKSGRCISSPLTNRAVMTARYSSFLRNSTPLSVAAGTCLRTFYHRSSRTRR